MSGALLRSLNAEFFSNFDCVTVLNNTFVEVFSSSFNSFPALDIFFNFIRMGSIIIDYVGIERIIKKLNTSSSVGVGNINSKFQKKTTNEYSCLILGKTFEHSLEHDHLFND